LAVVNGFKVFKFISLSIDLIHLIGIGKGPNIKIIPYGCNLLFDFSEIKSFDLILLCLSRQMN